jgi:hypothetical protein
LVDFAKGADIASSRPDHAIGVGTAPSPSAHRLVLLHPAIFSFAVIGVGDFGALLLSLGTGLLIVRRHAFSPGNRLAYAT